MIFDSKILPCRQLILVRSGCCRHTLINIHCVHYWTIYIPSKCLSLHAAMATGCLKTLPIKCCKYASSLLISPNYSQMFGRCGGQQNVTWLVAHFDCCNVVTCDKNISNTTRTWILRKLCYIQTPCKHTKAVRLTYLAYGHRETKHDQIVCNLHFSYESCHQH